MSEHEHFSWVYRRQLAVGSRFGIDAAIRDGANAVLSLVQPGPSLQLPDDVDHLVVPLADSAANARSDVRRAVRYAREMLMDTENRLLIHCHAGRSRSVVIAAMALGEHLGWEHGHALSVISQSRVIALSPGIEALFRFRA